MRNDTSHKVTYGSLPQCLRLMDTVDARGRAKEVECLLAVAIERLKAVEDENERMALEAGIELVIALHNDLLEAAEGRNVLPFAALPFWTIDGNALSLRQVLDSGFAVLEATEIQRAREAQAHA